MQAQNIPYRAAHRVAAGLTLGSAVHALAVTTSLLSRMTFSRLGSGRDSSDETHRDDPGLPRGVGPLLGDVVVERDDELGYTYLTWR